MWPHPWRRVAVIVAIILCGIFSGTSGRASGQPAQPPSEDSAFTLRSSVKSSLLLSQLPDDPLLFPDRGSATGFWRVRLEPSARVSDRVTVEGAFEQRVRAWSSTATTLGAGVLPAEAEAPYRMTQLDWRVASGANADWRAEVDRAALRVRLPRATVTIGRQAIGWGRGVMFGAVDLFAPFTPLEADREWRRGVDAARADVRLADRVSLDMVGALGTSIDRSVAAARVRGYAGEADVEVMAGRRASDPFAGATSSIAIGDVEVHGEAARFGDVTKAVAGGSYRVPLGHGLLTYVEYHYSGYGVASAAAMLAQLQDPAFQERYLRGDTQILGRHALAALASYEWSPEIALAGQWLQNSADGSGVVVPSLTITSGDRWSVLVSGYAPYGRAPFGLQLGSEFGAAPRALFLQLRMYR
ncbi:MAG: hypothetical protein HY048_18970 [Acidobacteria bacterium]|nr:hypothetical protein [Acidobacteriota bacterium]